MVCSDGFDEESSMVPMKGKDLMVIEGQEAEDRAITKGIMILSERVLAPLLENEPDIYTVEDLKVRFT